MTGKKIVVLGDLGTDQRYARCSHRRIGCLRWGYHWQ